MQLYEEPPEARGVISEAPLSIGDSSAKRKASGGSSPSRWGNSRERDRKAATANGAASQQAYIFPNRVYITLSDLTKTVNYLTKVYYFSCPELY